MPVLDFDKKNLGNLGYSLRREMLGTDRSGGYMSTTIVCCNTRKYHGLMVVPLEEVDPERNFVLLSSLDETLIKEGQPFNLAIHRYPGTYEPRGHKYITDFKYLPVPAITYCVGGAELLKEMMWIHSRSQLLIRYTLRKAALPVLLRLRPFLAFRDSHSLTAANMAADPHSYPAVEGVRNRLYGGFPDLYMQMSKPSEFVAAPDWHYNFEYAEEKERGYPYLEDLLTTGYFETSLEQGESVVFSCSLREEDASRLAAVFKEELAGRPAKDDFLSCLRHAAGQFVVRRGGRTEVVAGYPWFGRWGRDTFIALPGITLSRGRADLCMDVLDTMAGEMRDGLFPNIGSAYNSVDAPLWFFWTLQQLEKHVGAKEIWSRYGGRMKEILEAYRRGIGGIIALHTNGLVWADGRRHALTWMDAMVDGVPVTGRNGYQVEINALWYNAVCYTLELAKKLKDKEFTARWKEMPKFIKTSFLEKFWYEGEGYLADYVDDGGQNTFIRPNQIIACSLEHTMLDGEQMLAVFKTVKRHLLTPKGLRTLSPRNKLYQGRYWGDQPARDGQYHQGTVWVWPLEHYAAAGFRLYGQKFVPEAEEILSGFGEDMTDYGIGTIPEIYDGDPPHSPKGAISQAWSVGALLRIDEMIKGYGKKKR